MPIMPSTILFIDYEKSRPNLVQVLEANPGAKVFAFLNKDTVGWWPMLKPKVVPEFIQLPVEQDDCSFLIAYFIGRERLRNPQAKFKVYPANKQLAPLINGKHPSKKIIKNYTPAAPGDFKAKSVNSLKPTPNSNQPKTANGPVKQKNNTGNAAKQILTWMVNKLRTLNASPKNEKTLKIFFKCIRLNTTKNGKFPVNIANPKNAINLVADTCLKKHHKEWIADFTQLKKIENNPAFRWVR